MKKIKVLLLADISGLGPEYHVGDEAMAEVSITRLKDTLGIANLIVGCASPENVPKTYGTNSFAFYHTTNEQFRALLLKKPLSYFKAIWTNFFQVYNCDVVLVCGGGNMTSVWPGVLESRLRLLKIAKIFRRKIFFVSQTLGPYKEDHRKMVNSILNKASWIGVRDKHYSHRQIDSSVNFAMDDACYLIKNHYKESETIAKEAKSFATISMRKFGTMNDESVLSVAKSIHKVIHKYAINTIFIPHHAPKGTEGDIKLANNIKHLWGDDYFRIVDPIILASALKAITSQSNWVISMRYHQLIFSLSTGIPCVGIYVDEYTQAKLTGAFEAFGLKALVLSVHEVDEKLEELIQYAIQNRHDFENAALKLEGNLYEESIKPYELLSEAN